MIYTTTRLEDLRDIRNKLDNLIDRVEFNLDIPKKKEEKRPHDKENRL